MHNFDLEMSDTGIQERCGKSLLLLGVGPNVGAGLAVVGDSFPCHVQLVCSFNKR